jgi:hypothetical protein
VAVLKANRKDIIKGKERDQRFAKRFVESEVCEVFKTVIEMKTGMARSKVESLFLPSPKEDIKSYIKEIGQEAI